MARRRVMRAISALALLLVAACGAGQKDIVLRMTSWQSPEENAVDLPAVRAFEAAHPGVRVVNEPIPNQAEYREKVITSIVSGAPPDVVLLDGIDVPAFVDADVLLDIAPFAERVGLQLSDFYPKVLAMFSRGTHIYAMPKGFSPVVMYYNRALFDRASLPYPADGWTQAEFLAAARALTKDTDGDGVADVRPEPIVVADERRTPAEELGQAGRRRELPHPHERGDER